MTRSNEQQIVYWNEKAGPRWAAAESRITRCWAPRRERGLQVANATSGERVLDVGCGTGPSTVQLARAVGASGRVVGIDIARPNLAVARERMTREGLANVELLEADAQTHTFEKPFDLVFSIFGVMFFEDPVAAFTNLRRAQVEGGRLTFLCFQSLQRNPWALIPRQAAAPFLDLPALDPTAPGPFALADQDRTRDILEQAGYCDVHLASDEQPVEYAASLGEALDLYQVASAIAQPLADASPEQKANALAAIRVALEREVGEGPVRLGAATWVVSARTN